VSLEPHVDKDIWCVRPDETAAVAAARMEKAAVGCLVVRDEFGGVAGIITDRDLALRVVGRGLDGAQTLVQDVMSGPVVSVNAGCSLTEALETMRDQGVRRLPVLRDGLLAGLISYDDLFVGLAKEMGDLGEATRREFWRAGEHADLSGLAKRAR